MRKKVISWMFLWCIGISISSNLLAQRLMEQLDRGVFAQNRGDGSVYINWRLFATDDSGIGFNIYRSAGGGTAVKLNSSVITATTDYVDNNVDLARSNAYYVKPVLNGTEQAASEVYTLAANAASKQYLPIALQSISDGTYRVIHVYVGDIDGDGDYDYIVKRFLISDTGTGTIKLDCYSDNGTFLWRIDLGPNIETTNSPMTSPVLVYDFDSDGKAEVLAKTGESTTFGDGSVIGDTDGDGITDYNTYVYSDYAHVFEGPEFISMIDGETGAEIDRADFIERGNVCDWGDCYGARVNFIMASVAYLDGVHPAAVFSRGPGEHMVVEAWDFSSGSFSKLWNWTSVGKTFASGTSWVDFHQIKCVDVDGDGKDEMSWGSGMLDDNGTVLYTTELVHGDRFQIGDLNPNRSGLEAYAIQQNNPTYLGAALYDAKDGTILKRWYTSSISDVGRGDVGDINSSSIGMELWSLANPSLQSCTGNDISSSRPYPDLSVWWDGDLLREFFVGIGSGGYNPAINKWNSGTGSTDRLFTIYNDWGSYAVTCPYAGRAPYIGDIFGDWREEIALETSDHSELRIYTTKIKAQSRIYTLMHNPAYRVDVTTKGYLCSKLPDYYLGVGMLTPPTPNIILVGNQTRKIELDATGTNGQVNLTWTSENISTGQEIYRDTDSDPSGRTRIAIVNSATRSYSDADVTNGTTYYYWIKASDNSDNVINSNVAAGMPQACTPTAITPYVQIDGGSWNQATNATVAIGSSVKFGPQPTSGGSWNWSGPNSFSASTREITISNVSSSNAGAYIATYTNGSGCLSFKTFLIIVNSTSTASASLASNGMDNSSAILSEVSGSAENITGISILPPETDERFYICPNPVIADIANIKGYLAANENVSILVYDRVGKLVASNDLGYFTSGIFNGTFNTKGLEPGLYFIRIKTTTSVEVQPFVKQ